MIVNEQHKALHNPVIFFNKILDDFNSFRMLLISTLD